MTAAADAQAAPVVQHALLAFLADSAPAPTGPLTALAGWAETAGLGPVGPAAAYRLEATAPPIGDERPRNLFGLAGRPATGLLDIGLTRLPDVLPDPPAGVCCVLAVDRQVHVGPPEPGSALQRIGLTRRRQELDEAAFAAAWRTRHVPLVLAAGPRFSRYSTSIVCRGGVPWHGIAAQSFPSREAAAAHDHNNRVTHREVFDDASRIVAAAEQYWAVALPL